MYWNFGHNLSYCLFSPSPSPSLSLSLSIYLLPLSLSLSPLSLFQGDYKKTLDYFSKCYTYCQQLNDEEAIQSAQVQYGIAQAHFKMMEFTASIKDQSEGGIFQLVQWKGKRETSAGGAKPPKTNKEKKGGGGGGDEGKMERKESDRSVKIGTTEEEEEEEKGKEKEDNGEGAS